MVLANVPLWQELLFERPWPLIAALAATAVVLTVVARRRESRGLKVTAWSAAIVAGAIYALASMVVTEREQIERETRHLVAATESPMDLDRIAATWVDEHTVLLGPDGSVWLDHEQIRDRLARADEQRGIESQHVRSLRASVADRGRGRARIELSTRLAGDAGFGPLHTAWDLRWRRDDYGQWRLREIHWLSIRGQPAERHLLNR